eukprot:1371465-Amorphochlora_amoeboformis.AAC.1
MEEKGRGKKREIERLNHSKRDQATEMKETALTYAIELQYFRAPACAICLLVFASVIEFPTIYEKG